MLINYFLLGLLIGGLVMLMAGVLLGAITVEEKNREIKYLKHQLYLQAKEENSEY